MFGNNLPNNLPEEPSAANDAAQWSPQPFIVLALALLGITEAAVRLLYAPRAEPAAAPAAQALQRELRVGDFVRLVHADGDEYDLLVQATSDAARTEQGGLATKQTLGAALTEREPSTARRWGDIIFFFHLGQAQPKPVPKATAFVLTQRREDSEGGVHWLVDSLGEPLRSATRQREFPASALALERAGEVAVAVEGGQQQGRQ